MLRAPLHTSRCGRCRAWCARPGSANRRGRGERSLAQGRACPCRYPQSRLVLSRAARAWGGMRLSARGGSSWGATRRGAPRRAEVPNDPTAARRIPSAASVIHDYSTRPEAGQQYTGVPGLHDHPRSSLASRVLPAAMPRTCFPDSLTCATCHTPCCTVVPVTRPLRGSMLRGGTRQGRQGDHRLALGVSFPHGWFLLPCSGCTR
jgi:hypothetical protein